MVGGAQQVLTSPQVGQRTLATAEMIQGLAGSAAVGKWVIKLLSDHLTFFLIEQLITNIVININFN